MKIEEDKNITLEPPFYSGGSFQGIDPLTNEGDEDDFKLIEVSEWVGEFKLELKFKNSENQRSGFFHTEEGSAFGESILRSYKKELDDKLMGKTWVEIMKHNFTLNQASRI